MTRRAVLVLIALLVPGTGAAHDEFRFVGTLTAVDLPKNRFSVRFKEFDGKDETVLIAITPKTEITRDKKKVAKTELRAGLSVVVDALGDDYSNLEAVEVRIVPPPTRRGQVLN